MMQVHTAARRTEVRATLQAVRRKLEEALQLSKSQERELSKRG